MPILGINIPKMGMKSNTPSMQTSLADALFSGTQQRVLGLIFGQPERSFYATELIGLTGAGSGAVQRELASLANAGLLTVTTQGNQKHYKANTDAPVFSELRSLVLKTSGLVDVLRAVLVPVASQIQAAFVYGSVAKRQDTATSDIDLLVVSDTLAYADLFSALESASARLGRQINPTLYSHTEFSKRLRQRSAFATRVLGQDKLWVIGNDEFINVLTA